MIFGWSCWIVEKWFGYFRIIILSFFSDLVFHCVLIRKWMLFCYLSKSVLVRKELFMQMEGLIFNEAHCTRAVPDWPFLAFEVQFEFLHLVVYDKISLIFWNTWFLRLPRKNDCSKNSQLLFRGENNGSKVD